MKVINPAWKKQMLEKIETSIVDETLFQGVGIKWLIFTLSEKNIPFKVYNLGAGVKRITTRTETCPCCRRKL